MPGARVLRWDSDTTPTAGAHERLLEEFTSGGASVLIGTQMVAKGLDIPSVDLVGAVLADIGLHMPDFRAAERTFQLLTQVAGRAGRGDQPGHVVVQTYLPEHYAVQAAADQNYERFYAEEMEYRRAQSNPPVSKLARLLYRNSDPKAGAVEAARFAGRTPPHRQRMGYDKRGYHRPCAVLPAPSAECVALADHRARPPAACAARQSGRPPRMARRHRPGQHGLEVAKTFPEA